MAKKAKLRTKFFRTDDKDPKLGFEATIVDAQKPVDYMMRYDEVFVKNSKAGVPWECLMSKGAKGAAARDKGLFPHPAAYVYTEPTYVFFLAGEDKKTGKKIMIKYRHNFTRALREWDDIDPKQFLELFGGREVEIRLRVPTLKPSGEHGASKRHKHRDKTAPKRLKGAEARAHAAGLI